MLANYDDYFAQCPFRTARRLGLVIPLRLLPYFCLLLLPGLPVWSCTVLRLVSDALKRRTSIHSEQTSRETVVMSNLSNGIRIDRDHAAKHIRRRKVTEIQRFHTNILVINHSLIHLHIIDVIWIAKCREKKKRDAVETWMIITVLGGWKRS